MPTSAGTGSAIGCLVPIRGAELLFQVLTEREENNSVAIASNESFGGWSKTFTDPLVCGALVDRLPFGGNAQTSPAPRLCAAIVDRLTFGGNILETGTHSYRLPQTRAQQAAAAS